jgi:hypothetical protein
MGCRGCSHIQDHLVELSWALMNNGRTPAWVTELGSGGKIVKVGEKLPDIPPYTIAGPFEGDGTVMTPNGRIDRASRFQKHRWRR